jgi:hypothetical protein
LALSKSAGVNAESENIVDTEIAKRSVVTRAAIATARI